MIDSTLYQAFVIAVVVLVLTPGPDMMFIVTMGARGGPMAGLAAALGVSIGLAVHAVAAAFGLSALFTLVPPLYQALRWAGAAYLLHLAVMAYRDRNRSPLAAPEGGPAAMEPSRWTTLRKAVIVNVLNPKVILFNVAFLPQFINPQLGHVTGQFLILGATFVAIDLAIDGPIGLASGRLSRALRRSRRLARALNVFTATVFAGLAARLVLVRD